jgi:hypothetical protein
MPRKDHPRDSIRMHQRAHPTRNRMPNTHRILSHMHPQIPLREMRKTMGRPRHHSGRTMDCNYVLNSPHNDQCLQTATHIIIWGCLDQHISEFVVCKNHLSHWVAQTQQKQINCAYCYGQCAAFTSAPLTDLKKDAELHI